MTAATRTLKFWMTLAHISLGYENNTQTVEALKTNIRREIRRIPQEMCARVIQNFNVRVATVIQ